MKARMDKGKGEGYRCKTRQGEWRMEKDGRSTAGSRVITQSGITREKRGNEAAIAFCILSDSS